MSEQDIKSKTIELIDSLKATCQKAGMGNDGNEYKIITQVFICMKQDIQGQCSMTTWRSGVVR